MTLFLILCAIMAIVAAWLVAWPMLRRTPPSEIVAQPAANLDIYQDQLAELENDRQNGSLSDAQYDAAKLELERRLLQDVETTGAQMAAQSGARWPGVALASVLLLASGITYLALGKPEALVAQSPAFVSDSREAQLKQVEALLPKLVTHLENEPNDTTGWSMLGRSYMALERYPDAVRAYDKLAQLTPNDAQVLADFADALAMAQGQSLAGKPTQLLAAALKADPRNGKALYLSGFAALSAGDSQQAAKHWNTLLTLLPPESEDAQAVRARLAEIGQQTSTPVSQAVSPGTGLSGSVKLDNALRSNVQPGDTLFIFARAAEGPRMPLAILRLQAKDLPVNFALDDSMAMSPQMKLSNFSEVIVGARISKSGNAMPQSGDLEGLSQPVKVGSTGVTLTIDHMLP